MTRGLKHASITQGAAGTTTVVAAVAGKRIVVVNYTISMSAAGTAKWKSAANDITGAMNFGANGGASPNTDPDSALFQTNVGERLDLVTTGGAGNGHLTYREEEA